MDKEKGMFILTQRLKTAIEIINRVDISRFPLIVSRIAKKVHLKGDEQQAFSKTEQKQLEVVLGLSAADVSALLESTSFILEQAAYYVANTTTLEQQLTKIGVDPPHTAAFQKVWELERENVLLGLRDRTLVPKVLSDVNWQLHLHMAQSDLTRVKQPVALFELKLKSTEDAKSTTADKRDTKVAVEFTHDELYKFYNQLEKIQEQLDQLMFRKAYDWLAALLSCSDCSKSERPRSTAMSFRLPSDPNGPQWWRFKSTVKWVGGSLILGYLVMSATSPSAKEIDLIKRTTVGTDAKDYKSIAQDNQLIMHTILSSVPANSNSPASTTATMPSPQRDHPPKLPTLEDRIRGK